jgi:hypothetical protein
LQSGAGNFADFADWMNFVDFVYSADLADFTYFHKKFWKLCGIFAFCGVLRAEAIIIR